MGNPFSSLEIFDVGPRLLRGITDWIAGEDLQADSDPYEVQDRYNRQRDGVRGQAADVGFQGEFRAKEVLVEDEFEKDTLATLRGKVDQINLESVSNLVTAWNTIADQHQTSLDTFTQAMAKATDDSVWRGEARNSAAGAVRDYAAQGAQVTNAARLTGNKLSELQTGLAPTKELVPHVPEHRSGVDNLRSWTAGRGWRNDDVAEANSKTEALRVLRTVYAPVVKEADTNVPVIPRPAQVAKPGDGGDRPPGGDRPTGGGNDKPGGGNNNENEKPSDTETPGQDSTGSESADEPTTPSSNQSGDSSDTTTPQSADAGDGTTPAAATPSSPTTPGSGPGSPGSGSPSGSGSPGSGVPGAGSSIPGTPNNSSSASPAAGKSGSAGGRSGMPGMGGMGPGARGGKSEEESSKGTPDYLITQEHGDELTGLDELPKTVPPVIGE
ncbi:hypothetical protein [Nocardia australiensis]|uniref:hypothetical protein n=1 Tax=Nocardia australiensis TaxID=2887191 RepID=UPI001D15064A|nr:hypothetical protein [Nocardia australiensis]